MKQIEEVISVLKTDGVVDVEILKVHLEKMALVLESATGRNPNITLLSTAQEMIDAIDDFYVDIFNAHQNDNQTAEEHERVF